METHQLASLDFSVPSPPLLYGSCPSPNSVSLSCMILKAQQVKSLPVNAGNTGSISGLEDPMEEENGNLLWDSCLENPMDRGDWLVTVHEAAKNLTEHAAIHWGDHAVNFSFILKVKVKVAQSCPALCDPMGSKTPLSMGFSRQECWSGLPFPSPGMS